MLLRPGQPSSEGLSHGIGGEKHPSSRHSAEDRNSMNKDDLRTSAQL